MLENGFRRNRCVSLCFLAFAHTEPPYFTESLEPMEVTAGDAVCLKCQVAGTPEIKVSWFKADGKVRSSPTCKLEYTKGVACLKLSKATKSDIGEYTCKAENRIGSASSSCRLNVQAKTPPSFPKKITSLQQTEGQPVRFECRVAGSLPIEVSWLKDSKPLSQGEEFSMLYDDNTAVLQINNSEMRHSGEYTCVATNSVGSASCRAKLTLQGSSVFKHTWPIEWSPDQVLTLRAGDNVSLSCKITGRPVPQVLWYKEGKEIDKRTMIDIEITTGIGTSSLFIRDSNRNHRGIYTVEAKNSSGTRKADINVRVQAELDSKLIGETVTVTAGSDLVLDGAVGGKPEPTVYWSKGDKILELGEKYSLTYTATRAMAVIKSCDRYDTGRYILTVKNASGIKTAAVSVKVLGEQPKGH
uniref:Ig-like domain-containing protein n=1 Tax=Pundamilia nyererei TaxID=303518 RepID=A0A3B4GAP2_9CICH